MKHKEVREKVIEIINQQNPQNKVTEQSKLKEDLGFDSLDEVELIIKFEKAFGINLNSLEESNYDIVTVKDIVKKITAKLGVETEFKSADNINNPNMNTREKQVELVKMLLKTGVSDEARIFLEKQFPEAVESEDERILNALITHIRIYEGDFTTVGVTRLEMLDWLEKLKKQKKQKEQKPAEWSEEDYALLKEIVSFFKDGTVKLQHDLDLYAGFLENKFKSLRPQLHWKPSEEQMDILDKVYHYLWADRNATADMQDGLGDFIDDLKKL